MKPARKRQARHQREAGVEPCIVNGIEMGVPTPLAGPGDDYPQRLDGYEWPSTPFGQDMKWDADNLANMVSGFSVHPGMGRVPLDQMIFNRPFMGSQDEYTLVGTALACLYLMPLLRGDALADIPQSMIDYMDKTSREAAALITTPRDQLERFVRSLESMLDKLRRPATRLPQYYLLKAWVDGMRFTAAIVDELRQGQPVTPSALRPLLEMVAAFAGRDFDREATRIYQDYSHGLAAGSAVGDAARTNAEAAMVAARDRYLASVYPILRALTAETENFRRLLVAHHFGNDDTSSDRSTGSRVVGASPSLSDAHRKIKAARAEDPLMYRPTYVEDEGTWRSVLYGGSPYVIAYEVTRPNPKTGFPYRNKAMQRIVFYRNLTFSSKHTKQRDADGVFERAIEELDRLYDEDGNLVEKWRDRLRNLIAKYEPLYLRAMDIQQERRERGAARDSEDYRAGLVPGVKIPAGYPATPPPRQPDPSILAEEAAEAATTSGPSPNTDDSYYRSDLHAAFEKVKWPVRLGRRVSNDKDGRPCLYAGYLNLVFNGPDKPLDVYIGSEFYQTIPRELPDDVAQRALQMVADLRALIDRDDYQAFDAALIDAIRSTPYEKGVHYGPLIRPVIAKMSIDGRKLKPAEFAYLMTHRHRVKRSWEFGPWRFVAQTPNMNSTFSGQVVETAYLASRHTGELLHRVNLIPASQT